MNIKDVRLKKGMSRDEVNELIGEHGKLHDEIYLGNRYKHDWICNCGNIIKNKMWTTIKRTNLIKCDKCKYKQQEERYKYEVEKTGEYEYIRSYRRGDVLPNGKVVSNKVYIQVKHKYCGTIYEVRTDGFINEGDRCDYCCGSYEKSFAYHIEQELGEPIEKYWDFEKNIVNPYHISKNSHTKVWIKCTETDYHGSYENLCYVFKLECRCPYCNPSGNNPKIHPFDSFGYKHFDKAQSWHPDNDISPFKVAKSSNKKYKFICPECGYEWNSVLSAISQGSWCPQCNSSKGEQKISSWLRLNNINFIPQKEFDGLLGLGGGSLSYDFYLPEYNLLIEYQGEFHDGNVRNQTERKLERQKEHDRRKRNYAKRNNINLLEIWYWEFDNIEEILKKELNI